MTKFHIVGNSPRRCTADHPNACTVLGRNVSSPHFDTRDEAYHYILETLTKDTEKVDGRIDNVRRTFHTIHSPLSEFDQEMERVLYEGSVEELAVFARVYPDDADMARFMERVIALSKESKDGMRGVVSFAAMTPTSDKAYLQEVVTEHGDLTSLAFYATIVDGADKEAAFEQLANHWDPRAKLLFKKLQKDGWDAKVPLYDSVGDAAHEVRVIINRIITR